MIAAAARVARLLPAGSALFRYSGRPRMLHDQADPLCVRFQTDAGIVLEPSCGIDTSPYYQVWHQPPGRTEIVTTDFTSVVTQLV